MPDYDRYEASEDEKMVSRRHYLGGAAALATAATAGCSGILGGGGGSPEGAVQEFYTALNEGDADSANALLHPDGGADEITQQQADQLSQADFSVDSTEVVEQGDEQAIVEVTVTMSMMGQEETQSSQVELRTHDGQWKIWGEAV